MVLSYNPFSLLQKRFSKEYDKKLVSETISFVGGIVLVNGAIQNTKKLYWKIRKIPYYNNGVIFSSYEKGVSQE